MPCRHDVGWDDERYYEMPVCELHVDCDQRCKALTNPQTVEELRAALNHWRSHDYLSGCSHGC
jgi:hypothetical protein